MDSFFLFITSTIMDLMVQETNRYATAHMDTHISPKLYWHMLDICNEEF